MNWVVNERTISELKAKRLSVRNTVRFFVIYPAFSESASIVFVIAF